MNWIKWFLLPLIGCTMVAFAPLREPFHTYAIGASLAAMHGFGRSYQKRAKP